MVTDDYGYGEEQKQKLLAQAPAQLVRVWDGGGVDLWRSGASETFSQDAANSINFYGRYEQKRKGWYTGFLEFGVGGDENWLWTWWYLLENI